MTKSVYISEYNLAYTEGSKPVFLQLYIKGDASLEIGFCIADSPEEAMFLGAMKGKVVANYRVIDMFQELKRLATSVEPKN